MIYNQSINRSIFVLFDVKVIPQVHNCQNAIEFYKEDLIIVYMILLQLYDLKSYNEIGLI